MRKAIRNLCSSKKDSLSSIDEWFQQNKLNQFGDEEGTMYMGGNPLFDESTGTQKDRLTYLLDKFPNKPWNTNPKH